jgi:hypothetical protein
VKIQALQVGRRLRAAILLVPLKVPLPERVNDTQGAKAVAEEQLIPLTSVALSALARHGDRWSCQPADA